MTYILLKCVPVPKENQTVFSTESKRVQQRIKGVSAENQRNFIRDLKRVYDTKRNKKN